MERNCNVIESVKEPEKLSDEDIKSTIGFFADLFGGLKKELEEEE